MRRPARSLILILAALATCGGLALGGWAPFGIGQDSTAIDCDVPASMRVRNTGGSDGAGLCVFASLQMAAYYQNTKELLDIFQYMQTQEGGGWPEKVDRIMQERAPGVKYIQYQGDDLSFIQEGVNSGRPVCVTLGLGPDKIYGGQTIAHMVLCVGMNEKETAILDNNDPQNVWVIDTPTFKKYFIHPNTSGWAFYLLSPPPPPVPRYPD